MGVLGVWMWPESLLLHGAEKVVSYCARAGVTDIFFLTKGLSGTTAYRGALAPRTSDRDLLKELLSAAHKRGIRIHAWFTSACDAHYKQQHPESGRCHYVRGKDRELISLADEGYQNYMQKIVREVCRNYEIDGLHLDYIRYNHLMYGWAEEDFQRYAMEGADPACLRMLMHKTFLNETKNEDCIFDAYRAGNEAALALARTRRKDVIHFAHALIGAARAEKTNLILSAALMPEGAYEDTAFSDLHYGQNYEDAAGIYDYALPMAYSRAYEQNAAWVRKVAEGTLKRGMRTIVGLHAYEGGTGNSLQEDVAALQTTAVEGICLFREGATAMAYDEGKELCVYNALNEPIIKATAKSGEQAAVLQDAILPGEEKRFSVPFHAQTLQVFTSAGESCVYFAKENFFSE